MGIQVVSRSSICCRVFGALRKFGVWTQIPQIKVRESYIESHSRCLTQLLMLNEALVCLGIGASQGKNPNKGHEYTEIHP